MSRVVELGEALGAILGTDRLLDPFTAEPISHVLVASIERLSPKSLPSLGPKAFELYEHSFPNPDEREPIEEIIDRIKRYATSGPDADGGDFHSHVFLDDQGRVIAYSQGSVMPCGKVRLAKLLRRSFDAIDRFVQCITNGVN